MPHYSGVRYGETVERAAITFVAMSFRPELQSSLLEEIATAVAIRGGRVDNHWLAKFELAAVLEEVAERTITILSVALRERLPDVADEMDEAFGKSLRKLLTSFSHLFPTL
jgi:hypothetical protein